MLAFLVQLMMQAECEYHLKARWKGFVERHIIADDPYDETTRKIREEQEKEKDDEANKD